MKFLPIRYLTVFIILLFSAGINEDQLLIGNNKLSEISFRNWSKNESSEKNCLNLELRESESRPLNHGEKVETIVIPSPVSDYSKVKHIGFYNLQVTMFSNKKQSLISHSNLLFSKLLHKSPLINILRI